MEPSGRDEPLSNPAEDVDAIAEEDEGECGWCRWMKAGGCTDEFQVWLDCVDKVKAEGREDVESCASIMGPLWECMDRHKDYYAPQLSSLADRKKAAGEGEEDDDMEPSQGQGQGQEGAQAGKGGESSGAGSGAAGSGAEAQKASGSGSGAKQSVAAR